MGISIAVTRQPSLKATITLISTNSVFILYRMCQCDREKLSLFISFALTGYWRGCPSFLISIDDLDVLFEYCLSENFPPFCTILEIYKISCVLQLLTFCQSSALQILPQLIFNFVYGMFSMCFKNKIKDAYLFKIEIGVSGFSQKVLHTPRSVHIDTCISFLLLPYKTITKLSSYNLQVRSPTHRFHWAESKAL